MILSTDRNKFGFYTVIKLENSFFEYFIHTDQNIYEYFIQDLKEITKGVVTTSYVTNNIIP